jgi:hypothetical protein
MSQESSPERSPLIKTILVLCLTLLSLFVLLLTAGMMALCSFFVTNPDLYPGDIGDRAATYLGFMAVGGSLLEWGFVWLLVRYRHCEWGAVANSCGGLEECALTDKSSRCILPSTTSSKDLASTTTMEPTPYVCAIAQDQSYPGYPPQPFKYRRAGVDRLCHVLVEFLYQTSGFSCWQH